MILRRVRLAAISAVAVGSACVLPGGEDEGGSASGADSTTSGSTSVGESGTAEGTTGPGESTSLDGSTSVGEESSSGGGTGGPADSCSDATLFIGNPTYGGTDLPDPAGEPVDGVPLAYRHLVFSGSSVVTHVGEEIWAADLSAGAPAFVRLVGETQEGLPAFGLGPCATARLGNTRGLVDLGDGSFAVADYAGNALLVVEDLQGGACEVVALAGNADPSTGLVEPPNAGDVDGTGTAAQLLGPKALVAGDAGTLHFIDDGNVKVKSVTLGGAVTTLASLPTDEPIWNAMTVMGGALWVVGTTSQEDAIVRIDAADGTTEVVLQGNGELFAPLDSSSIANLQAVATDGSGLIVTGKGYVWYVTPDGTVTHTAGIGVVPDYPPPGYDPLAPHPALELVLKHPNGGTTTGGAAMYMTYDAGDLYWGSTAEADAFYVHRIACP